MTQRRRRSSSSSSCSTTPLRRLLHVGLLVCCITGGHLNGRYWMFQHWSDANFFLSFHLQIVHIKQAAIGWASWRRSDHLDSKILNCFPRDGGEENCNISLGEVLMEDKQEQDGARWIYLLFLFIGIFILIKGNWWRTIVWRYQNFLLKTNSLMVVKGASRIYWRYEQSRWIGGILKIPNRILMNSANKFLESSWKCEILCSRIP